MTLKKDTSENKSEKLNANTQIVFTIKSFFSLIGSMLILFYGFYQLVIAPRITQNETHYKEMFETQQTQNNITNDKLNNIYNSIGNLSGVVQGMNMNKPDTKSTNKKNGGIIGH